MDVTLVKGNEKIVVKYGPTLFPMVILIPLVGLLVALLMWFRRRQFREILCQLFLLMLLMFFTIFCGSVLYQVVPQLAAGLWFACGIAWFVLYTYFIASSIKNANTWRIRSLLLQGYKCDNQQVVKLVNEYKKPKWMIFSSF